MKNVAPYSVSGRVVNTVTSVVAPPGASVPAAAPAGAAPSGGAMVKTTSAPVDLPIQLRCIVMTRSGHDSSLSKSFSKPLGVVGDAEEPLRQLLGLHRGVAALACAFHDLLVGKDGLTRGAPVDRGFFLVGQPLLVELEEQPLGPLVVFGTRGHHLASPVDGDAQAPKLPVDGGDRFFGENGRRFAGLYRHVLGVEPEGVIPHGMKHPLPLMPPEAGDDVAHGVVLDVPHVRAARRVGKHLEDVGGILALACGARSRPLGWPRRTSCARPRPSATWSRSARDRTCASCVVLPPSSVLSRRAADAYASPAAFCQAIIPARPPRAKQHSVRVPESPSEPGDSREWRRRSSRGSHR